MNKYTEKIVLLVVYIIIIAIFLGILVTIIIDLYNLYLFKYNSIFINAEVVEIVNEKKILIKYNIEYQQYKKQLVVGEKWIRNNYNNKNISIKINERNYKHAIYNIDGKIYRKIFYIIIGVLLIVWVLHYVIEIILELNIK